MGLDVVSVDKALAANAHTGAMDLDYKVWQVPSQVPDFRRVKQVGTINVDEIRL